MGLRLFWLPTNGSNLMTTTTPSNKGIYARLELIWWLITAIAIALVLLPIYSSLGQNFPFYTVNIVFIAGFITLTRYLFLLKHTFLAERTYLKLALMFLSVPAIFLLVQEVNLFQVYVDENGAEALVGSLPRDRQLPMMAYIRNEMVLFGVGCTIAAIAFPLRMVMSLWRRYNGKPD